MTHKHKYKIGQKVIVNDVNGEILNLGFATNGTSKFTLCDATKEIPVENQLGYHVFLGRKIKIIKECDINLS